MGSWTHRVLYDQHIELFQLSQDHHYKFTQSEVVTSSARVHFFWWIGTNQECKCDVRNESKHRCVMRRYLHLYPQRFPIRSVKTQLIRCSFVLVIIFRLFLVSAVSTDSCSEFFSKYQRWISFDQLGSAFRCFLVVFRPLNPLPVVSQLLRSSTIMASEEATITVLIPNKRVEVFHYEIKYWNSDVFLHVNLNQNCGAANDGECDEKNGWTAVDHAK